MSSVEPITTEELRELDMRLLLSRVSDNIQWRTVSMAEYAKLRAYIRYLEKKVDVDVEEQLRLRERNCLELVSFLDTIFVSTQKILSHLELEVPCVQDALERVQLSQEG